MSSNLSLGEKLRQVHKSKELSLANIAHDTGLSESTIGRIERGEEVGGNPTPEQLSAIKKALDIPKAPLLEYEVETYESQLWYAKELIYTERFVEAKNAIHDLTVIFDLPFEKDLGAILLLLEARLLMIEYNNEEAIKRIDKVDTYLNERGHHVRDEVLFLFHFNKSVYYLLANDGKRAVDNGLKALNYENGKLKSDMRVFRAIGMAYFHLGQHFHAVRYLERAVLALSGENATSNVVSLLKLNLATCYIHTNELDKAQKLLDEAHNKAVSTNNERYIDSTFLELGRISHIRGDYDNALIYYDQAILRQKERNPSEYVRGLIYKIVTLIRTKQFVECEQLIDEGRNIINTHKDDIFAVNGDEMLIYYNDLHHRANLKDRSSVVYLENVSIPHYRKVGPKFVALDICSELEEHYKKQRSKMKELAIGVVMRDILLEMMYGEA